MRIVCLGDSLTSGCLGAAGVGIADPQEKNYPNFLAEILHCQTSNYGVPGANAASYLAYYDAGNVDLTGADMILLFLGTNGGMDPLKDVPGNRKYLSIIERCQRDAPGAKLVLCTPPHATTDPSKPCYGAAEKVEKAVKVVRRMAMGQQLPLIDLAERPEFTEETEDTMQPHDGLHFGVEGYRVLAQVIAEELQKLFPDLF